jgi:lipoate-protein ligase B
LAERHGGTPVRIEPIRCSWLGIVEYGQAFALQESLVAARADDQIGDTLLLLEHPPVVTLGRRGRWDDIHLSPEQLAAHGIGACETNRGGLVTYHGPGQLVGYVIARLAELGGTAPAFVQGLEETIIRALDELGVSAERRPPHRGVWTSQGKLAAIGVGVRRGVTMHGFALNVQPDLRHFDLINACGIGDLGVTSIERLLGWIVDPASVRRAIAFHFGRVFERRVTWVEPGGVTGVASGSERTSVMQHSPLWAAAEPS